MSSITTVMIGCSPSNYKILDECTYLYDKHVGLNNNRRWISIEGGTKSRGMGIIGGYINHFNNDIMLEILSQKNILDGEYGYLFTHKEDCLPSIYVS